MRIVVTGAAGVLGSRVAQLLAATHSVLATDRLPAPTSALDWAVADLAEYDQAAGVIAGAEVVVHCAAIHPWKSYTDEQYLSANVLATYQVAKACVQHHVRWLVLTSSIAAVGYPGQFEPHELPIAEDATPRGVHIYDLTKTLAEDVVKFEHRRSGLQVWAIRPPTFIPWEDEQQRIRGLVAGAWATADDIARAHVCAVAVPPHGYETAYLQPAVPYTPDDIARSRAGETAAVLDRHFPGLTTWLAAQGIELPGLAAPFNSDVARDRLGWEPTDSLAAWWAAVKP